MIQTTSRQDISTRNIVRALVLTGYGLNCDYETDFSLKLAGAESHKCHINDVISGIYGTEIKLSDYQILIFGGGFSWADDHGAGVLMATKLKHHLGEQIHQFIHDGKLILGICNGFQALVNLGLVPGFDQDYSKRHVALTYNDSGNFVDTWVRLQVNEKSPCVFTRGISSIELPVRHGEGKFYAEDETLDRLFENKQVALQYSDETGNTAGGSPMNPNGSLRNIAGICDPTGRIFGMMPHPEAFNHYTNHPNWTLKKEALIRKSTFVEHQEGEGIQIFRNAVTYLQKNFFE